MRKRKLSILLCVLIFLAGCAGNHADMSGNMTGEVKMENVIRRAYQHEVISEEWGTLSWMASKALGNAEGLTVGRATIKAGQTNPRHRHPKSEEVLLLLKGRIQHSLGDKTITMKAGDVITIAPGVFHNATCIGDEDAEMVVVYSEGARGFELE